MLRQILGLEYMENRLLANKDYELRSVLAYFSLKRQSCGTLNKQIVPLYIFSGFSLRFLRGKIPLLILFYNIEHETSILL
jgi:hypothetical protein